MSIAEVEEVIFGMPFIRRTRQGRYIIIGDILFNLRRYEEALAACEQAIGLDPKNAIAYINKGAALAELKRYEEALVACEQAIGLDPRVPLAY